MKAYVRERQQRVVHNKGIKAQVPTPSEMCKVCEKGYKHKMMRPDEMVLPGVCPECQEMLDEGYIAFKCDKFYAFGRSKSLQDLNGTVQFISPPVMQKMREVFNMEWKKAEADAKSTPSDNGKN